MGSDNLFHRRKAKKTSDLARRRAKRSAYQKILIVCEGEKTEPNYFNELIDYYELNTANVKIDGSCGSSPQSVYEAALELYSKEKKSGDPFDRVFCVFDKDTHTTYVDTVAIISQHKPKKIFQAVKSVPCFEFWLILHFLLITKPYVATGNKSAADCVISDLRQYIPDYEKGDKDVFAPLHSQLGRAIHNSKQVNEEAAKNDTDNPSTDIGELVSFLKNIKSEATG